MEENGKDIESIRKKIVSKNPLAFIAKFKPEEVQDEVHMEVEVRPSNLIQNVHHIKG